MTAGLFFKHTFLKTSPVTYHVIRSLMLRSGTIVQGESGRQYRLQSPLSKTPSMVWRAADIKDESLGYVIKAPNVHDSPSLDWPLFHHELAMQRRFENCPLIRRMVDFVPRFERSPPMMVLQAFEQSLWSARNIRPLSLKEIKWIMKAVLMGLWAIHREGLVYSDLKMENILVNGFENDGPASLHSIIARLADCGAITKPSSREITSIAYRSPEVYFGRPWTSSTDIWSWGMIYCHLVEAHADILSPGIYDSISKGTLEEKTRAVRDTIAMDFSLRSIPFYADGSKGSKLLSSQDDELSDDDSGWCDRLLQKGVPAQEVAFLLKVLVPSPDERPSAEDIIWSGYLDNP